MGSFFTAMIKTWDKGNLRVEGFILADVLLFPLMTEKTWQKEKGAAAQNCVKRQEAECIQVPTSFHPSY